MGAYLKDSRHHAERIKHFYDHAGFAGHAQAQYHRDELSRLYSSAAKSKNDSGDAPAILAIIESCETMMTEMKKRRDEANGGADESSTNG
jgi:hypothetical protein